MSAQGRYYVYVVRCEDGSLYTGITTDVTRRMRQHLGLLVSGARYTRLRRPVELAGLWECDGRAAASRLEYRVKQLPRPKKDQLLAHPGLANDLAARPGEVEPFRPAPAADRTRLWEAAGEKA